MGFYSASIIIVEHDADNTLTTIETLEIAEEENSVDSE